MGYVGNQQTEGFSQVPAKQDLTGATGTSLTLTHAVASAEGIDLYINNVRQEPTEAYSVVGTAVTLTGSVVATDDIYVVYNSLALQTTTPPDASVSTAKIIDGDVTSAKLDTNIAITGDLTVDTSTLKVDSTNNRVGIGTASPTNILHVSGTAGTPVLIERTNGAVCTLAFKGNTTTNNPYLGANGDDLYFNTGTSEAMRINSDGRVTISNSNVTNPSVVSSGSETFTMSGALGIVNQSSTPIGINRDGNDGELIAFRQATVKEGGISVSGTTVSYNGGHLSRWSQLADNTKDETIVKGTVLTNLDQMAVWTNDGVTEENEQLNCMAVSSVEGDPNVAGVFVNWDEDDDIYTNDMNVAMTGDMVIRITSGTTVARGDLLMSAGDGTAKPQGDDIVRSKTIAKVISTHVSHTYDDGSYLVPCVLMAC